MYVVCPVSAVRGKRRRPLQAVFEFRTHGGKRAGAGRKRRAARPQVAHRPREALDGRTPVHVTLRMRPEIARLRKRDQYRAVREAMLRTGHHAEFRICQYSIQGNHVHLIVEPGSAAALSRGMASFNISCAKRLNRSFGRRGRVFSDRYHARALRTPAEVRRALAYTLNNWRHHGEDKGTGWYTDPFSSAAFFDGWRNDHRPRPPPWLEDERVPVARAQFWLLREGWRRHGAIDPREAPGR